MEAKIDTRVINVTYTSLSRENNLALVVTLDVFYEKLIQNFLRSLCEIKAFQTMRLPLDGKILCYFLETTTTFMETGGSNEFDIIALIKRN